MDSFLPSRRQQYLLQNYQQSSEYRPYHQHIPSYLHNRPRSTIIHCLERKTNSSKILSSQIIDVDADKGIYEIVKESGKRHTVDFGSGGEPSCTCKDWIRYHIPCKHFFSIFTHRPLWQWDKLPQSYLQSAYLSSDTDAIHEYFQSPSEDPPNSPPTAIESSEPVMSEIQKVSYFYMYMCSVNITT